MKKLCGLIIAMLVLSGMNAFASIEVLPTMQSQSEAEDKAWVGTFQLVWNDFMDKFVHGKVQLSGGELVMTDELNNREFSTDEISEACYYKTAERITRRTKKNIKKAIKKKFNETSDILDKMDLKPGKRNYVIYAMLKKDFEFLNAFDKLGKSDFGSSQKAKYFGINPKSDKKLHRGVEVLFYNSPEDYAVKLLTKNNDEVYLYKNASKDNFKTVYAEILAKEESFEGGRFFKEKDELKVPDIKFFNEKTFEELSRRAVLGTNIVIDKAMESIKFEMNNKGVKLKSEAAMSIMRTSLNPFVEEPRYFYFDDTFFIFLKEKDKKVPYFALRVNNIENYQ